MELQFGKQRGKYRLSQNEERELAAKGAEWVGQELRSLIKQSTHDQMTMVEAVYHIKQIFLANSLLWIYAQLEAQRITSNLEYLLVHSGLNSLQELANKTGCNASFLWRTLVSRKNFGGWNVQNLAIISEALKVSPAAFLFADLKAKIAAEIQRFEN